MIITISGKPGSGKSTIAKLIAKELNLKYFSVGKILRDLAKQKNKTILQISEFAKTHKEIDKELDRVQKQLGENQDNFIIEGRLGWYFIPNSIKIFLDIKDEIAAKRIFNDKKRKETYKNIEQALQKIKQRAKAEKERYKKYYNIDYLNKSNYDIIINTSNLTIKQVLEKTIKKIKTTKQDKFHMAHDSK